MFGFCRHKWLLIDKTLLPSALEQIAAAHPQSRLKMEGYNDVAAMAQKMVVYIFQCSKCTKVKKVSQELFEPDVEVTN